MQPACHSVPGAASTMAGLPQWVFWSSVAAAMLLTLWSLFRTTERSRSSRRWNLLELRLVRATVSRRPFQFALQVPLVLTLLLILSAGFFGTRVAERNFATVATWTIWWTLLIVDIVLLGRMWCLVCPWDAIASWIRRLAFWRRRTDEPLALEIPWPKWLRNVYPATLLFLGLTWLELGFGVTRNPRATAILGLAMILLAVIPALIFEKRSFCKYGCLIGRICGLYSMIAPVEVRAIDTDVCRACTTKDCLKGNERGYPCPTGQYLGAMTENTYCTICTECVKSCTKENVAINLRGWASDLHTLERPRRDEAILALVMLSMTSFHGLTMTPAWNVYIEWMRGVTGLQFLPSFTIGMTLVLLVPALLYLVFSAFASRLSPPRRGDLESPLSPWFAMAARYAYPLIAVALMYHLAHNAGHFLVEAGNVVPVLSNPFGNGMDLFGTAGFTPRALATAPLIWLLQIGLVMLGLFWGLSATERAHRWLARERSISMVTLRTRIVSSAFLLLITLANLWLLAQPMEMRTGM